MLSYNVQNGVLRNTWASDHTQNLAFGVPLLVLDVYEHAYAIDYGAGTAQYIAAFMENVNWPEVARRLEEAQARRLPGPFAGGGSTPRANYRTLASIVNVPGADEVFYFRLDGPTKSVLAHRDAYLKMLKSGKTN